MQDPGARLVISTHTALAQLAALDAWHRTHARVEDRIRCANYTDPGHFPSRSFVISTAWLAHLIAQGKQLLT
jgi:hypothetical protein